MVITTILTTLRLVAPSYGGDLQVPLLSDDMATRSSGVHIAMRQTFGIDRGSDGRSELAIFLSFLLRSRGTHPVEGGSSGQRLHKVPTLAAYRQQHMKSPVGGEADSVPQLPAASTPIPSMSDDVPRPVVQEAAPEVNEAEDKSKMLTASKPMQPMSEASPHLMVWEAAPEAKKAAGETTLLPILPKPTPISNGGMAQVCQPHHGWHATTMARKPATT